VSLVGIVGGDGSMGLVLSHLYRAYHKKQLPKILVLRGGTINFLASNLGISTLPEVFLRDTMTALRAKQSLYSVHLNTIDVNGRLGFIFANGMACSFLEEYYKNKTNSFGAALTLSKVFLDGLSGGHFTGAFDRMTPLIPMKIHAEPVSLGQNLGYSLVFISTVPKLPFGAHVFQKITLNKAQDMAQMLAISQRGKHLIKSAWKAMTSGRIGGQKDVEDVLVEKVQFQCPQNASYSLDGDLFYTENGTINVRMGPVFEFCSPYRIPRQDMYEKR
jgi:diacylglycerol kinase family enzyme